LGWVTQNGPMDNSGLDSVRTRRWTQTRTAMQSYPIAGFMAVTNTHISH